MEIKLRAPRADDVPKLAELCAEMGYPSSVSEVEKRMQSLSDHDDHMVLVAADEQDKPVAWVHTHLSFRLVAEIFVELGGLVVSETHRGQGIGEELLAEAERWAEAQGVSLIRVRSNIVRRRAHGFYERAGYEKFKTQQVFEKSLRQPPPC
jgi:GNAT superfamily N-acetyltransferase